MFQSTRPSRGATARAPAGLPWRSGFNPRAPRGARLASQARLPRGKVVSIHAPLAGRDGFESRGKAPLDLFQSTRPSRGATCASSAMAGNRGVSIHAPLAGRDCVQGVLGFLRIGFNPRAPRGARRFTALQLADPQSFQSTRPSRGATVALFAALHVFVVSIHAPLAGRDASAASPLRRRPRFNPRAPRGARPVQFSGEKPAAKGFNPRAPRGARLRKAISRHWIQRFQSTRPSRGATPRGRQTRGP